MKLTWSDVGLTVGKVAPLLGGIMGGPVGAGIGVVGNMIAKAFGCDNTPDAIHAAVQADPQAAVKLAQIEADNRTQLAQIAADQAIARHHEAVADRGSARDRQVKSGSVTPDVLTWLLVASVAAIAYALFSGFMSKVDSATATLVGVIIHAVLRYTQEAVTFQFGEDTPDPTDDKP